MRQRCALAYRLNNSVQCYRMKGCLEYTYKYTTLPSMQTFSEFNFSYDFTTTK